jgi:hypothetical protein
MIFSASAIFMLIYAASTPQNESVNYRNIVEESSKKCADKSVTEPYRSGNVICLRGEINQKLKNGFFKLLPKRGDVVVSSGPGGDISAAMDIGDFIYENDILVVIDDLCGSSCSYFIALGGRRLALYDNGLLGFHGGPIPKTDIMKIPNITKNDRKKVLYDNNRFKKFFTKRNIEIRITNEIPKNLVEDGADWKSSMWVRWPDEMQSFGFEGIVFCSGKYCKKGQ